MLDLRRLRLLRELARRSTITAVAEALSYSPSAVSQQLAALEKEAGVRLSSPSAAGLGSPPKATCWSRIPRCCWRKWNGPKLNWRSP